MRCAPTDRLIQTISIEAPGVTEPMVKLSLFNAMDTFFRRTSRWQWRADVTLEEGVDEYPIDLPVNSEVVRSLGAAYQYSAVPSSGQAGIVQSSVGRLSHELTFPDGDASFAPAISDLSSGLFTYSIYRPEYITTTFSPSADQTKYPLELLLALTVNKSCLKDECGDWQIPEWMYDMFFDDFLEGTLSRLMSMPAKPWFNEKGAIIHSKRFRNAMAYRKQEAMRG